MRKKTDRLFLLVFGIVLLIECIALYKAKYHYYGFARLLTSILLSVFVFKRTEVKFIRLYFYIGLSFALVADMLTLYFTGYWFYLGISLFTFSYLSFAAIFFRYRQIKERRSFPPILLVLAIVLAVLVALYYYLPNIREVLVFIQSTIHAIVVGILFFWAFKGNKRTKGRNQYFFPSAILVVLANICYAIDVNLVNRKYVLLDIAVVLLHGVYLLLLAIAVNQYKKIPETDAITHHPESTRRRHRTHHSR